MDALIIGDSRGIGAQLRVQLEGHGAAVYGVSRACAEDDFHLQADITKDEMPSNFLPSTLDALVYMPGTINLKPFHRLSIEMMMEDLKTNALGAVRALQWAYPALKKQSGASVVLMSTVAVGTGMPFHSSIGIAKGAIEGLTRALAAEWAPEIRVNCVALSLTDTPLAEKLLNTPEKREAGARRHPLGRVGTVQDAAHAIEFLLGPNSAWMTGQVLAVDGGMGALRV